MNPEDDEDCSCSDCTYSVRPGHKSAKHLRKKPINSDKLSYGENIQPRERKLLNKLVETRALYNDVRSQILSCDECDDSCAAEQSEDFDKRQKGDHIDNKAKHAVRSIVDVIDRGEIPPLETTHHKSKKPFDDCETCCTYDTDAHLYKNAHLHKQVNAKKKVETHSSSRLHTKHKKVGDRNRKMRNVHFHTKNIRSDPCTCTMNILGIANKKTKTTSLKYADSKTPTVIESKALKAKRCVCECNLRNKSFSKMSLRMVKGARDKVRQSIRSSISKLENKFRIKKDSIMIYKDKLKKNKSLKKYECEPGYCIPEECLPLSCNEKVKAKLGNAKRSIHETARKISEISLKAVKRKQKLKSNHVCICEPEPESEEQPHRYYDKIKLGVGSFGKSVHDVVKKSIEDVAKVASDASIKVVHKIQSKRKDKLKSNHVCICEPEPEPEERSNKYYDKIKSGLGSIKRSFHHIKRSFHDISKVASGVSIKVVSKIHSKRKQKSKPVVCLCEPEPVTDPTTFYGIEDEPVPPKRRSNKQTHKKTGLSIHIEPSKLTKKSIKKSTKKSIQVICKCDKVDKKHREVSEITKTEPIFDTNIHSGVKDAKVPHPRVCEASICIPDECDYRKCAEILMSQYKPREASVHSSDKGVDSIPRKRSKHSQYMFQIPHGEDKTTEGPTKQVVRIGSNFSFSIDFYKENSKDTNEKQQSHIQEREQKNVPSKTRLNAPRKVRSRNKSIQSVEKKVCNSSTCHDLKRCFCTLALKDEPNGVKSSLLTREKSSSAHFNKNKPSSICECDVRRIEKTQTKKTKKSISVKSSSFARDSFFDSLKNCDPKSCKRKLNNSFSQNLKRHSIGTTSPISRTKYSIKSQCSDMCSNKYTKSLNNNPSITSSIKEPTTASKIERERNDTSSRNVLRIGSSFSFDIQFYKERQGYNGDIPFKSQKLSFESSKNNMRKIERIAKAKKSSRKILTDSDETFKKKCSRSCGSVSNFSTTKSQTYPNNTNINVDKATKTKPLKKKSQDISEYDISRTTQTSGQAVYVTPPISTIPRYTKDICVPFCKQKHKRRSFKHNLKSKRISTDKRMKSISNNTVRSLSDASSSKRQMLKHIRKTQFKDYDTMNTDQEGSHRQAVRIGSSFSFNIEFYKEQQGHSEKESVRKTPFLDKDVKVTHAPKYNANSQIIKPLNAPRRCCQKSTQVSNVNNIPKVSIIRPLLDRCKCTLKLFKARKNTTQISSQPKRIAKAQKAQTCQCEIRKSAYHSLYQSKHTTTDTKGFKSLSDGTSKSYMKNQKLQAVAPELHDSISVKKDTSSYTKVREDQESRSNKQLVRISSSFSFNVEFYKERGDYKQNDKLAQINQPRKINKKDSDIKVKGKTCLRKRVCNKKTLAHIQSKDNDISELPTSMMKRCFCTLKRLKNRREIQKPQTRNKSVIVKESKKAYNKRISTKRQCEKCIDTKSLCRDSYATQSQTTGPMKSIICSTDNRKIKSRAQKIQSDYTENKKKPYRMKNKTEEQNFPSNLSCNCNTELNKENVKSPRINGRQANVLKLPQIQRTYQDKKFARDRRSTVISKRSKPSNFGLILKQCMHKRCPHKNLNIDRTEKRNFMSQKDTQAKIPKLNICVPNSCEKSVMANKKQRKVQSVLDVKNPRLKTKKVKSNLKEASTKIHSDQSIKREMPKQRHRLHKTASKKAARLGSAFKFDIEFYKQFGSLEDDGSINYKKLRRDQQEHLNEGLKEKLSIKKIFDKRINGPRFPRHREYQVGYIVNEGIAPVTSPFQQQLDICYVHIPNKKLWKSSAVVNPVIIEGNPYRNINTKSNIKGRYNKKNTRGKKHVSFQKNIDKQIQTNTATKHNYTDVNSKTFVRLKKRRKSSNNQKYDLNNEDECYLKGCKCCAKGRQKSRKKDGKLRRLSGYLDEYKNSSQRKYKDLHIPSWSQNHSLAKDVEIIKPYSKRNFRKVNSRNCLKNKCALREYNDRMREGQSQKVLLKPNKTYYGLLYARRTLDKFRKSLHRSQNVCNEVCMARGRTNIVKSGTGILRKSVILKHNKPIASKRLEESVETRSREETKISKGVKKLNLKRTTINEGQIEEEEDKKEAKVMDEKVKNKKGKNKKIKVGKINNGKTNDKKSAKERTEMLQSAAAKGEKKKDKNLIKDKTPCLCGSTICDKISKEQEPGHKKKKEVTSKKEPPPCTCGSEVCKTKSKLEAESKHKEDNICECISFKSLKQGKFKKKQKQLAKKPKAKKPKAKKTKIKKRKRKKEKPRKECCADIKKMLREREEMRLAKRYKQTSDTMLIAESILDVAKMGVDVLWNTIKGTFKLVTQPKASYEEIKDTVRNPSLAKKKCLNSNLTALAVRIKSKIAAMRMTRNTKELLESNTYSNYIIHSCDNNPSKRLLKVKKVRRRRERLDFECSPYMASLRKRPYLWFYDRCPSMYPQFLSLLAMWRQFLDIILFLVAIAVWSPCILGVEVCRAAMCCLLCTG